MAVNRKFVVKHGLDANGISIDNLGAVGSNLAFSGGHSVTLTTTGTTALTLPTSGTLVTDAWTGGSSITSVGTITSGTWNGSIIQPAYGGTGVANSNTLTLSGQNFTLSGSLGARTITTASNITVSGATTNGRTLTFATGDADRTVTLANNFSTSGNFALTLTTTAATNVTLPTTGTLATLAGTETFTNKTLTSPTISGGTINNASVGATTPSTGAFTTLTSTGITTASGGLRTASGASQYPAYMVNLDWGADVANTWRRVFSATLANATFSTIGLIIEIEDPQANHGTIGSVDNMRRAVYHVALVRTESTTLDTPDACYVRGPSDHVRAVKTALGSYEVQVQNATANREIAVKVWIYASNGTHTYSFHAGDLGAAGTAQYNASVSTTSHEWFQNIVMAGQVRGNAADTASSPAFTWSDDTNTGVFHPEADAIGFSTGGAERFRIISNGAWGLGGANYGTAGQVLTSNGSGTAPTWQAFSATNVANSVTFNSAGTGGASGSSFNGSSALTVSYNTIGAAPTASPTFTGTSLFAFGAAATPSIAFSGDTGTGIYRVSSGVLGFSTSGTQAMSLDASGNATIIGNLGVNATTPSASIAINSDMTMSVDAQRMGVQNILRLDNTLPLTADRNHYAAYNLIEMQTQNSVAFTANSYGAYNIARTTTAAGNSLDGEGTLTGAMNYALHQTADATFTRVESMFGAQNQSLVTGATSIGDNVYGSFNLVQASSAGSTINTAYGVRSRIISNNATSTITNGYLFYGDFSATGTLTNRYGLYIPSSTAYNFVAGGFQVGGTAQTAGATGLPGLGVGVAPAGSGTITSSSSISAGTQFLALNADTTANPGYSWTGDVTTGIYHPAASTIGIVTAGTERLRVDASGAIGIAGANYGTSGQVLRSNGPGAAVSWGSVGTVTSVAVSGANGIGVGGTPITSSGTISLSLGNITPTGVQVGTGTNGYVTLISGTATNSGYIAFHAHTSGNRQGYIGFSNTNAAADTGTIPYVAGTHAFTGNITATGSITATGGFSGSGASLTSLNASNLSSGTVASARISGVYNGFSEITSSGAILAGGSMVIRGAGAGQEGGQLTLGYGNALAQTITGQANNTWNVDVDSAQTFRIFRQNAGGTVAQAINIAESTGAVTILQGLTVSAGGLGVSAGGASIAGGLTVTSGGLSVTGGAFRADASSGNTMGGNTTYTGYASVLTVNYAGAGTTYGIALRSNSSATQTSAITFLGAASTASVPVVVGTIAQTAGDANMNLTGSWLLNGNPIVTSVSGNITANGIERTTAGVLTLNSSNAAGTIDLRTAGASRMTIDSTGVVTTSTLRLTATNDVTLASTAHALQIGADAGINLAIDNNEIQARNNGAASSLSLNLEGGNVNIGSAASVVAVDGILSVAAGSVSAPSIRMAADADTGFYSVANTSISVAIAGANELTISGGLSSFGGKVSGSSNGLSVASWTTTGCTSAWTAGTVTDNSSIAGATVTNRVANSFSAPTFAATNTGVVVTNAATIYVAGAPAGGTNVTVTNPYAIWVDAGEVRFDGIVNATANQAATSTTTGSIQVTGGIGLTGALYAGGEVTAFSDRRVKGDFEVIPDALAKVEKVSGYTYIRTDLPEENGKRHAGVIAQEIEEILPEVVTTDPETGMKGVAYGNMVALLIEATKELSAQVKTLQAEIAELKKGK